MASNGKFLAVVQPIRLENTGWEIRVREHDDFKTLYSVIYDWVSFSISPELNGSGTGSITLNLDTPYFSRSLPGGGDPLSLLDREYLFEAWENGSLRFQWLGRNVEESRVAEDETRTVTISGPGTAELLKNAAILRPGWPKPVPSKVTNNPEFASGTDNSPAYKWIFPPTWPVMRMWYTLLKSAQKRGAATWIKPTFTATKDSGGARWQYVPTVSTTTGNGFSPTTGQNLWDFLQDCTGQDYSQYFAEFCEWVMWPGFKLDVRPIIGAHREKRVIFYEGQMHDKSRTRSREEIGNVVIVADNTGRDSHVTNLPSVAKWNRREYWYDQAEGTTTIAARRTAVARNVLKQKKDEKSEWTIRVPAFDQYRRPFYDYNIGDWIGIGSYNPRGGGSTTVAAYRVLAITVTVADETPTVELTLQDELQYRQMQLQKQLTWIIHQVTAKPQTPSDEKTKSNTTVSNTFEAQGYVTDIRVFIQPTDPGTKARAGDLWYDTSYVLGNSYAYTPAPTKTTTWLNGGGVDYSDDPVQPKLHWTPSDYDTLNPNVALGGTPPKDSGNDNPNVNPGWGR